MKKERNSCSHYSLTSPWEKEAMHARCTCWTLAWHGSTPQPLVRCDLHVLLQASGALCAMPPSTLTKTRQVSGHKRKAILWSAAWKLMFSFHWIYVSMCHGNLGSYGMVVYVCYPTSGKKKKTVGTENVLKGICVQ